MKKRSVVLMFGALPASVLPASAAASEECSAAPFTAVADIILEGADDGRADRTATACRLLGSFIATERGMC